MFLALSAFLVHVVLAQGAPSGSETPLGTEAPAVLVPPELQDFVDAPYPRGVDQGSVSIDLILLVAEDGYVEHVEAEAGPEPFRTLAVEAAQRFTFFPALEGPQPVAVELPFSYVFPAPPVNLTIDVRLVGLDGSPGIQKVQVDGVEHMTDEGGHLELRNVIPGPHVVRHVHSAYQSEPVSFDLVEGERADVAVVAEPLVADLALLGVYRRRGPATIQRTITAEEVRTTPGTMGDPIRAVQNLPGVVRTPLDAGWLLVRGGDPEDTGLFIDGLRVPLIYHLGGYTSVLHPRMVEAVTFMPGGYDARYGRSTGGAVELETRQVGEHVQAQVGVDLVASGAYVEAPTGDRGGVAVAVRRSYLDAVLSALPNITADQARIAPRFWDFMFRADEGDVGLLFFGFADSIDAPTGDSDETVTVTIGTTRVHGRYDFHLLGRKFRLSPMYAHNWRTIEVVGLDDLQLSDIGGGRVETVDDGEGTIGTSFGLDLEGGWFGTRVNTIDAEGRYVSLDPHAALRVGSQTSVTAGLRAESLLVIGQQLRMAPSPRIDFRHPLSANTEVVGDFGLYHQFPPLDIAIGLPGGPYLPLEESWGGGAGFNTRYEAIEVEVAAYARKLQNVTIFEEDESLGLGSGLAYGVETITRYEHDRVSGWVSYTWSRSLRREEPSDLLVPHTYDQPHFLVAVAAYDLGKEWTLAGRWRYASGYVLTDTDRAYDILSEETIFLVPDASGRLPAFHALDLKISKEFVFRNWALDAYLDVQNVYDRRVPEPAITGLTNQDTVYTFGLFTLPIFGVQGHFGPGSGRVGRASEASERTPDGS